MRSILGAMVMVGLALASLGAPRVSGQGAKREVLESKSEAAPRAAAIVFAKELGLDLHALSTLGARIDAARDASDPVVLAALASELAAAESAAGKTASLKAADLAKEAVDLARQRQSSAELKVVAVLTGEKDKDLAALAKTVQAAELKAVKDRQAGEKSRGIMGRLHVDSRVQGTSLRIYVDGQYVGTVPPFGDREYGIYQTPEETTFLMARSNDGRVWRRSVSRAVNNYTWQVND